jgi:hypothetical protein
LLFVGGGDVGGLAAFNSSSVSEESAAVELAGVWVVVVLSSLAGADAGSGAWLTSVAVEVKGSLW